MGGVSRRRAAFVAVLFGAMVLSACGSGTSAGGPTGGTQTQVAGGQGTTGAASPSTSSSGGHSGHSGHPHSDPYPALCRKIDPADAAALFSKPIGAMTSGGTSDCQFAPRGSLDDTQALKVFLRIHDADKTLFDHIGDISYGRFRPLHGLGYTAKWGSTKDSAPTVVDVRKGVFTCTVIPPSDLSVLAVDHAGVAAHRAMTTTTAAAFAGKIGQLCRDVFSKH